MQGLKFERYECMGFTYWASGLERPVIDAHEAPSASGRLSVLQSVLADIRSLLQTEADLPAAHGPLDFFTAQAQVRPRSRLQAASAATTDAGKRTSPAPPANSMSWSAAQLPRSGRQPYAIHCKAFLCVCACSIRATVCNPLQSVPVRLCLLTMTPPLQEPWAAECHGPCVSKQSTHAAMHHSAKYMCRTLHLDGHARPSSAAAAAATGSRRGLSLQPEASGSTECRALRSTRGG